MNISRVRTEILGIAFCSLILAAFSCARPAPDSESSAGDGEYDPNCKEETTLRIAGRDQVITRDEAEQIRQTFETYLAEEKPDLERGVDGPGKAFIDCEGTVRMGAWILESTSSDKPELQLTFRVVSGESFMVRQIVDLAQEGGRWKVTGVDVQTAHRLN